MRNISRGLAAVPVALTLLPLWRTGRGWVRIWDFPRTQVFALAAFAAAVVLRRKPLDRAVLAALSGTMLYQASKILPYTPLWKKQVQRATDHRQEKHIRLLMANVLQNNNRADLVLEAVAKQDPDIVCLVETDSWWENHLQPLEEKYPISVKCPLDNTYGMLLYSRLPLHNCETRFLVNPEIPSMRAEVELPSGDRIVLYALHPKPPLPGSPTWGRDAELVLAGLEIDGEERPAVVVGDLNDVAWSYTTTLFKRLSHTLDPRVGRGFYNSFHADVPLLRWPLDHVFHTPHFRLVDLHRLEHIGSDHFPIFVELSYEPALKHEADTPSEPTPDDKEEAVEILEDARKDVGTQTPTG